MPRLSPLLCDVEDMYDAGIYRRTKDVTGHIKNVC